MDWLAIFGCVIGAWAMLRIVGGERDSRLAELGQAAKQAAADTADGKDE